MQEPEAANRLGALKPFSSQIKYLACHIMKFWPKHAPAAAPGRHSQAGFAEKQQPSTGCSGTLLPMNIEQPMKDLGPVAMESLQASVLGLDEDAWLANSLRQEEFEVHKQTRSVVLVFCDVAKGDLEVSKSEGWDSLADVAVPVMHDIIERFYAPGGTIIRAMAAKLLAGGRINPHRDAHATFSQSHRIHVPITTNSRVRFMIDGRPFQMNIGNAYEINNQKAHSVMNSGKEDRITFIFDYLPRDAIVSSKST